MKVYVNTDLECIAGVVTLPEYCLSGPDNKYHRCEGGKHYQQACELATLEVNAAIDGLREGGATEILVCDGHGHGGLNPAMIHPQSRILTGLAQRQPRGLDHSFDAAIMIGQHAMANTDGGHLCHSGSFDRDDWRLNGQSIGEIGLFMIVCSYFNIPVVMISGDVPACQEASRLVPSIETVAVIEGQKLGSTRGMTIDQAIDLNVPAIHVSPIKARQMIRDAAQRCLAKIDNIQRYFVDPPYEMVRLSRPRDDGTTRRAVNKSHDFIQLLQQKPHYETIPYETRKVQKLD